jgi:hypothetical protein
MFALYHESQREGNAPQLVKKKIKKGDIQWRAVAQTVSRWLPTAAAQIRDRAACGVCGG